MAAMGRMVVVALLALVAAAARAAPAGAHQGLLVGVCSPAVLAPDHRDLARAVPKTDKKVVVLRAAHGHGVEHLQACEQSFAVARAHEAFLMEDRLAASLPETVAAAATVHHIAGTGFAVVDIAPSALEAFASVSGERQLLRPLAPRMKRAHAPLILNQQHRATKDEVVASLNDSEFNTVMRRLSGAEPAPVGGTPITFNTRHTLSTQNRQAAQYIFEYFEEIGYTDVFYHEFQYSTTTTRNIIAAKRGVTYPDEIVVFGAHMDSTSPQSSTLAPGCIDNGSGTGSVMVTARAFANVTTDRTIYFMLFSAEEQGLIGSEVFVEEFYETGELNIVSALTMDMIGYSGDYLGVLIEGDRDGHVLPWLGQPAIVELMDGMEANTIRYAPELTIEKAYFSYGSDHVSFQNAGIASFLSIEQDNVDYPGYHAVSDTVAYLSVEQSMGITRGMAGLLYDVAGGR